MIRLFVALELPPPVRDRLLGAMGGVSGARWQTDAQLHLTLRFIGEVDRHQARDIAAALGSVHVVPFKLALGDIGTFDRRGRIDTLWVGVTPQAEVAALARRVDQALVRVGVSPETRAFVPHITVARFGRDAGPMGGFPLLPLPVAPFDVTGFALWESRMGRDGSEYSVVDRYLPPAGSGREIR
ncbi:RNA 2',3'-cyclic phosphodiesterase [Sandarakinorhabdus sp. DWP1-3-1]|uniref:RNA 2',3'-cyclic phosphodiesterase n=1 Tax=Sandarakinorhabdus sp. DWP1-3-1 TaxID=2804627 RepID=UPI003CE6DCF3